MTTACTQCGKRTTPDSIHTCSPQVQRDETLPEADAWRYLSDLPRCVYYIAGTPSNDAESLYTEATLREAIKGARKKALTEALVAMDDTEEPRWYGYDCPNTWQDGKWQAMAAARKLLEDEQ